MIDDKPYIWRKTKKKPEKNVIAGKTKFFTENGQIGTICKIIWLLWNPVDCNVSDLNLMYYFGLFFCEISTVDFPLKFEVKLKFVYLMEVKGKIIFIWVSSGVTYDVYSYWSMHFHIWNEIKQHALNGMQKYLRQQVNTVISICRHRLQFSPSDVFDVFLDWHAFLCFNFLFSNAAS